MKQKMLISNFVILPIRDVKEIHHPDCGFSRRAGTKTETDKTGIFLLHHDLLQFLIFISLNKYLNTTLNFKNKMYWYIKIFYFFRVPILAGKSINIIVFFQKYSSERKPDIRTTDIRAPKLKIFRLNSLLITECKIPNFVFFYFIYNV